MLRADHLSTEHAVSPPLQKRDAASRAQIIRALASAEVAIVPTMVVYYRWRLVPPDEARRIVDDSMGGAMHGAAMSRSDLLADWREQIAERGGVKDG